MQLTSGKQRGLEAISDERGIIFATAMDQHGTLGKKIHSYNNKITNDTGLSEFKKGVSDILGNKSSAVLLDPEYGWDAADKLQDHVGLIMAYEKTGYDASEKGR